MDGGLTCMSKRALFIDAVLSSQTDDCILWPFAIRRSSGYGAHSEQRKDKKMNFDVHRLIASIFYSRQRGEVAHSCNRKLCCNPRHVRFTSHADNMADMVKAGRAVGGGRYRQKLGSAEIIDIRYGGQSLGVLAKKYSMEAAYIGRVRRGEAPVWAFNI